MALRIAITGPESSGKTAIAKLLAEKMNGIFIPEFAREYLQNKSHYFQNDLDDIARGQMKQWQIEGDLLIADTELTVIKIWSEFKYNNCSEFILDSYENQAFDHYFLCKPDIPWEPDPLRENENEREELFELYLAELKQMKRPFTILSENLENRLALCDAVISNLVKA